MNESYSLKIDGYSGLATVSADRTPDWIERALNEEGFTAGLWTVGDETPLESYLNGEFILEPYLKYGDIHDLVAALSVRLSDGRQAETFLSPRSAAGPNLRYWLMGQRRENVKPLSAVLRVRPLPQAAQRSAFLADSAEEAFGVLREEVQDGNRPDLIRTYDPDSIRHMAGGEGRRSLVLFGYEGDRADVAFRMERLTKRFQAIRGQALEIASDAGAFMNEATPPPLFGPIRKEQHPEVRVHSAFRWSRIPPLMEDFQRRAQGIYPVQLSLTGLWHEGGLISMRLLSHAGERDGRIVSTELNDLLGIMEAKEAVFLEISPLRGKLSIDRERLLTDPETEAFLTP